MSLRAKAFQGVQWLSSSTAVTVIINFAQTAVLSRLLETRDFGLTAMIWVFLGFAQMFSDMGFGVVVVQKKHVTPEELTTVHWLNVMIGCLIAAVAILGRPAFVAYYREPELAGLVPWVAVTFIVTALGLQFHTLAQRKLDFHYMAIGNVLAAVAAFVVSVVAAWRGAGAYAIVYGGLASSFARGIWFASRIWSFWHPTFHFRFSDLSEFMRLGLFQVGDRIANYVWNNADYALAGRFLGSAPLGVYRVAYETVIRPLVTVNPVLNTVALPVFAKRQDDNSALRFGFLEMTRLIAVIVSPLMAGLCAIAPLAVSVVFGSKWAEAGTIIQILSPLGLIRSLLNPIGSLLAAKGLLDRVFYLNLTLAIVLPTGFWFAVQYGIEALAGSAVVLLMTVLILTWKPLYEKTIGLTPWEYLGTLAKPVTFSLVMGATVWEAGRLLEPTGMPAILRLALLIGLGGAIYGSLLVSLDRAYLRRLMEYRRTGTKANHSSAVVTLQD